MRRIANTLLMVLRIPVGIVVGIFGGLIMSEELARWGSKLAGLSEYDPDPKFLTGSEAMIGRMGKVVATFDKKSDGTVEIDGELWSARADGTSNFRPGDIVVVKAMEGLKLIVERGKYSSV